MPYDSLGVANAMLDSAQAKGKSLDPLQLQKLLYFAHGWYLALRNEPLLNEYVEAWPYGPVVPSVYHAFKSWGYSNILGRARNVFSPDPAAALPGPKDPFVIALLDRIIETYGDRDGLDLVKLTHTEDSPWTETVRESGGLRGKDIPNESIKQYFDKLMEVSRQS